MIRINLLPPEYRPRTGTPVARFAAIVVGIVMVLSAGGAYAYTHFIELTKVRELKQSREEEVASTEMQRDRSLRLQQEIDAYAQRRRAIQTINRSRTLWSRKLDQFFDIVTGQDNDDSFALWLDTVEVPTKVATLRRRTPKKRQKASAEPAAQFKFEGFLAMTSDSEAPALLSGFHKALTGDPENTGRPTDFYGDFMAINNPNIEMLREGRARKGEDELLPPRVGAFNYDLALAPVDLEAKKSAPAKRSGK
jgi:cell division protein FtsB